MIPRRAPDLLLRQIDDEFAYAVNCAFPSSFRLLNKAQYEILSSIDGKDDLSGLSGRLGIDSNLLHEFLLMLSSTEIVRFDDEFRQPQRPASPKSLNFWIHTTNACNLVCSYCYISTLNTSKGMSVEVRKQLLHKLQETVRQRGIKHVKFRLAGGEPLTQFKSWKSFIPEAKSLLAELGCAMEFAFITNLTILNDEIIDFSKEYCISYGVSVDGVDAMHNLTRSFRSGEGSFSVVEKNLKSLLAKDIPVAVTTVISNQNLSGLPDLTRYFIALDIPFRYSIVKGEALDAVTLEKYLSECYTIMKEAVETGWQFSKRHQFCDLKPNDLGFQTCASGFSGGAIYVDGNLKYCHVNFGDEAEPSHSIFETEMDLVDMIEKGSHYEGEKSEDCKKCRYRHVCTSGCPVYRENGKDPQCSIYHKFIPMIYELQARERLNLLRQCEIV